MSLALIAGQGALPAILVAAMPAEQSRPFIAALTQFPPEGLSVDFPFRIETLGSLIDNLKARGVTQICLAGSIARPAIEPGLIDEATRPLVPRLMTGLALGDDGALTVALALLEEAGFEIVSAADIAPDLLPLAGVLTQSAPKSVHEADAKRGKDIVAALGAADIGQACVVVKGQALALESVSGTDWMLKSLTIPAPTSDSTTSEMLGDLLGSAADWLSGSDAAPDAPRERDPSLPTGGILFKGPKPTQDLRVDMPTIGPATVHGAAIAGLEGIVIQHGAVLVLNLPAVIAACDAAGLFLWVRP